MRRAGAMLSLILILVLVAAGCGAPNMGTADQAWDPEPGGYDRAGYDDAAAPPTEAGVDYDSADLGAADRKIIHTVSLSLEVGDIQETVTRITALARDSGGYISRSSIYGHERGQRHGFIELRVPAHTLDDVVAESREMGKVTSDDVDTQDVTEEYIDLDARVTNLRHQESRYQELLERADSVEDVLKVERELSRVRMEIDSLSGRLKYLSDRVDLATVRLDLREVDEDGPVITSSGWQDIGTRAVNALFRGINRLLDRTADLVVWLFGALPVLLVTTILILVARAILKRRKPNFPRFWPPSSRRDTSGTA